MNDFQDAPTPPTAANAPERLWFEDDGRTPNSRYPVLCYRGLTLADGSPADALEALFAHNGWPPQWRGGVFDYHHYHARAHETLGVARGQATLVLGGEGGRAIDLHARDVLVLPAGTGHCRHSASEDFELVAAYPPDQQNWDLCRPGDTDIATARATIAALTTPGNDPVGGAHGALTRDWCETNKPREL
ncbi:cupin [Salinisphaera sp. S4-8]|uniref:cupin n=1 Tax=Salinisphaera sp. S4-8 TaxID=633357 RepID=UPI00333E73E2